MSVAKVMVLGDAALASSSIAEDLVSNGVVAVMTHDQLTWRVRFGFGEANRA